MIHKVIIIKQNHRYQEKFLFWKKCNLEKTYTQPKMHVRLREILTTRIEIVIIFLRMQ